MVLQLRSALGREKVMRHSHVWLALFITVGFFSFNPQPQATLSDPLTTIELETPVHFLAPDGSDLVVEAGTYTIEPAEEWIRVMSGERHDALLIEAKKGTHELELEQTMALSVSGESEDEQDVHHVMLLLPGGESLEATGTYSGIRARGLFQKTFNRVKKKAKNTYKKAKSTAKKATSQAKDTAQRAKKQVQKSATQGMTQPKKGVQNVGKQIQKSGKNAVTQGRKGMQSARKAALHTKREIEKTGRRVASRVKSGMQKARQTVTGGSGKWTLWSQTAAAAARKEARGWLSQINIDRNNCQVMATVAIGKPGVLKSRYSFKGEIGKALKAVGASKSVAEGWDKAFKESWELWAKNVMIPGLPFYPAFAAFPGPQVPPMPNVPFPLSTLISAGVKAMTPPALAKKIQTRIGAVATTQEAKTAVNGFATDFGRRFTQCMAGCQLMNVIGTGPVPSFAPPFISVGPVVGGSCTGGNIPAAVGFFQP
jgi:hypothetical protein